jgi:hypothetical protein
MRPQIIGSTPEVIMNSDEMTTSPTIETVLDRINQLGQQLRAEIKTSAEGTGLCSNRRP